MFSGLCAHYGRRVLFNLILAPFESRDRDAFFVVASTSVRSVDLRLLTHHAREGEDFGEKKDDEEAAADDEPESISVPVHGLGTVSILSAPVSAR